MKKNLLPVNAMLLATIMIGCTPTRELKKTNTPMMPTYSPTNTLTASATPSLSPNPTLTPLPTFQTEDAQSTFLNLLATNSNCLLPCFWGITPGISTYQQARNILEPLSGISTFTFINNNLGNLSPKYKEGDLIIDVLMAFLTENDTVNSISFQARAWTEMKETQGALSIYDSPIFGEKLQFYMLPNILSEYGIPSSATMFTFSAYPNPKSEHSGIFEILLLYPEKGMLIQYSTSMRVVGDTIVGCPANAHVKMELYPSGNGASFVNSLPSDWQEKVNHATSLQDASSMSLEAFYEAFRQPTEKCIVTPASIWAPFPEGGG